MTAVSPSPGSVQVQELAASDNLRIQYSRAPERFAINRAIARVPSPRVIGRYLRISSAAGTMIDGTTGGNWPDGTPRPRGYPVPHEMPLFECDRSSFGGRLGTLTVDQAQWDILASHSQVYAQQAMTDKTFQFESLVSTPSSLGGGDTMTNLVSGTIISTDASTRYIRKAFDAAKGAIVAATHGAVARSQVICCMGSDTAVAIAQSAEAAAFMVNHSAAYAAFGSGFDPSVGAGTVDQFGLFLSTIFQTPIVIFEERVTTGGAQKPDPSPNERTFFQGLGTIETVDVKDPMIFLARGSGQLQQRPAPSATEAQPVNLPAWDAVTEIYFEDMTVETRVEGFDRIADIGVAQNFDMVMTAQEASFGVYSALG